MAADDWTDILKSENNDFSYDAKIVKIAGAKNSISYDELDSINDGYLYVADFVHVIKYDHTIYSGIKTYHVV